MLNLRFHEMVIRAKFRKHSYINYLLLFLKVYSKTIIIVHKKATYFCQHFI